jgi:hypothetical protein
MTIHNSLFFDNFGQLLSKYPDVDLKDLFSKGQMQSKRWLINQLSMIDRNLGTVFVCGGWYGSLSAFLLESGLKIKCIRSFDIDASCAPIADTVNRSWVIDGWKFKASTYDIMDMISYPINYSTNRFDGSVVEMSDYPNTIINTSSEHIKDFNKWYSAIPSDTLVVIQNNNYFELPEHINCVSSVEELSEQTPMEITLYLGELELPKYKRFMKIGIK